MFELNETTTIIASSTGTAGRACGTVKCDCPNQISCLSGNSKDVNNCYWNSTTKHCYAVDRDCNVTFTPASCTKQCGEGVTIYNVTIIQAQSGNGAACPAAPNQTCNNFLCPCPVYDDWTPCTSSPDSCIGSQTRIRHDDGNCAWPINVPLTKTCKPTPCSTSPSQWVDLTANATSGQLYLEFCWDQTLFPSTKLELMCVVGLQLDDQAIMDILLNHADFNATRNAVFFVPSSNYSCSVYQQQFNGLLTQFGSIDSVDDTCSVFIECWALQQYSAPHVVSETLTGPLSSALAVNASVQLSLSDVQHKNQTVQLLWEFDQTAAYESGTNQSVPCKMTIDSLFWLTVALTSPSPLDPHVQASIIDVQVIAQSIDQLGFTEPIATLHTDLSAVQNDFTSVSSAGGSTVHIDIPVELRQSLKPCTAANATCTLLIKIWIDELYNASYTPQHTAALFHPLLRALHPIKLATAASSSSSSHIIGEYGVAVNIQVNDTSTIINGQIALKPMWYALLVIVLTVTIMIL